MEHTLDALIERRKQINALISENIQNAMTALFNCAPVDERKALAVQLEDFDRQLADLDSQIGAVIKATRDDEELEKKETQKDTWKGIKAKLNGSFADSAKQMIDSLKVQILPSSECVEPNDAFIKALFRFGSNSFKLALQGKKFGVREKRKTKKKDAIFSKLAVQNAEGYDDDNPLSEFDRAVLGVIISEYLSGNRYTTVNIIHRALIGKVGEVGAILRKNQQAAIVSSVIKLMATLVDFSCVSDSLLEMNYTDNDGNSVRLKNSNLLFADIVDAKINGQEMDGVIFFKDISPLFYIADAKSQVIRYPHQLLNVLNQNNTPRIISIKKYVLRRICEIKLHKMTPTITFDDVFKKCRLLDCSRKVKMDARISITKLFEHLQENNFILRFELIQHRNTFIAVKFTF